MALIYFDTVAGGAEFEFLPGTDDVIFSTDGIDPGDIRLTRVDAGTDADSEVDDLQIFMQNGPNAGKSIVLLDVQPEDLTNSDFSWSGSGFVIVGDNDPTDGDTDQDGGGNDINGTGDGDYLMGLGGNDTVTALGGNDVIDMSVGMGGGYGQDVIDGGTGTDLLLFGTSMTSGVVVNLTTNTVTGGVAGSGATLTSIEDLSGTQFGDRLTGNGGVNRFSGLAGNDTLNGASGNDSLNGGGGVDSIQGAAGNDTLIWSSGDVFRGGADFDTLKVISGNLNLLSVGNGKITDVEQINVRGGENNTVTLNVQDVLDLSSTTNTLKILGDAGDIVNIDTPALGTPTVQGDFMRYQFGSAILLIDADINVV